MGKKLWTNTMHDEKQWTNAMGKKILDNPINTLWRSPQFFHLSPLFPYFFHITPMMYVELAPYPLGSIPPFVTTTSGDDWRTRPWSRWTISSNGSNGPHYRKVCMLLLFVSQIKILKIIKIFRFLLLLIITRWSWEILHTMNSTLWSGWSRVGAFACSRGEIHTTRRTIHGKPGTSNIPLNKFSNLWEL